jgi:hypothetical protein
MPRTTADYTGSTWSSTLSSATGSDSIMIVTGSTDNTVINNVFESIATSSIHIEAIQTRLNHKQVNTLPCDATNQYIHAKTIENRSDISKIYTHTTYNMGHDSILLNARDMYTLEGSVTSSIKINEYTDWLGGKDYSVIIPPQHIQYIDFQIPAKTSLDYYDKSANGINGTNPVFNMGGETGLSLKGAMLAVDSVEELWGGSSTEVIRYPLKTSNFALTIPGAFMANLNSGNHNLRHFRLRIQNKSANNTDIYFKSVRIPLRLDL